MILLTNKEIESVGAKALSDNPHWEPDAWGLFSVVAKTQAKKMANWLEVYCESGRPRRECGHCWRKLLEEIALL